MKSAPLAAVALLGFTPIALAAPVIVFGQTGALNTITATNNANGTTLSDSGIAVSITEIDAVLATPIPAFLSITATSEQPGATNIGGLISEHFDGKFAITQNANGSGTNYLSGAFNDGAVTATGSTSIAMFASQAVFTSDVVTALDLPRSVSFALTNVSPPVSLAACANCTSGQTIAAFDASIAGNASANVPEPAALALMGVGLLGLTMVRYRRS
jgi:hypothetical protein